jgi:hypothetical protein
MAQAIINLIATVFSALFAGIACTITWYVWRSQMDVQQQANSEEKLNTFLTNTYLLRPYAWSVWAKQYDFVTERNEVRQAFIANAQNWEKRLDAELVIRTVHEMGHSLQQLGLSAFLGAVPLTLVFAVAGDNIALDWLIVRPYIAQLNEKESIVSRKNTYAPVFARRRHAEWVTTLAYLWLNANWDCRNLHGGVLQRMYEQVPKGEMIKRVEDITHADAELFTASTANSIKRLIGISLHHCRKVRN